MIHTSRQLKALVINKSHEDNARATTLIRNFVMERLLGLIKSDAGLMEQWKIYQRKYDYAENYNWEDIVRNVEQLFIMLV